MKAPQKIVNPQQWPHIFAPGEPKIYGELSLAEFCAGYLVIIKQLADKPSHAALINHFHGQRWDRTITKFFAGAWLSAMGRQLRAIYAVLLTTYLSSHWSSTQAAKPSSKSLTTSLESPSTVARHQICDAWSWYNDCASSDCPKSHICVVCKSPDHQALRCPKRKFLVPPRRSDTASKVSLDLSAAEFSTSTSQIFDQPPHPPASQMTGYRHSNPVPYFPLKSSLISHLITLHAQLRKATCPNTFTFRLPVPSQLNIREF